MTLIEKMRNNVLSDICDAYGLQENRDIEVSSSWVLREKNLYQCKVETAGEPESAVHLEVRFSDGSFNRYSVTMLHVDLEQENGFEICA